MFRYIALFVGLALLPSASLADRLAAPRPLSAAFHAAGRGDWAMADLLASKAAPEAQVFGAHVSRERARAAMQQGVASYFGVQSEIYGLSEPLGHEEQAAREAHQLAAHCDALPSEILPMMVDIQRLRDAELARATAQALAKTDGPVVVITGNGHARKDWGMPVHLTKARADLLVYSIGQGETGLMPEGVFDEVTYSPAASRDDPCAAFSKD